MAKKLDEVISPILDKIPEQVKLQLPKLKKVGDNKTTPPKVKLPKLKKLSNEVSA